MPGWMFEATALSAIYARLLDFGIEETAAAAMVDGLIILRNPPWTAQYKDKIPALAQYLAVRELAHALHCND